ncbi:putative copper resistance protein D [Brevibacterium siliguriense]|uniref:Putative copper resistance protein D n=1 Tax=Brevibacterium siliguriense TaxID=1136497 RepID=A0A1H1Q9M1_9MICO|nr:cytochrome c oxidase assembly protein [Brevibacterium siliguriense]SDS20218.1 putative copper resistance protein D [Brevibacterium siliguriense]
MLRSDGRAQEQTPLNRTGADEAAARLPTLIVVVVAMAAVSLAVAVRTGAYLGPEAYTSIAREFPGSAVATAAAVLRSVAEMFSVLSLGTLTLGLMFISRTRSLGWSSASHSVRGMLRIFSAVWSTTALILIVVDALNTNGTSFSALGGPSQLWFALTATFYARAWLIVFGAAFLVFVVSMFAESWAAHAFALGVGSVSVLAPVVISQVLVGPNHDLAEDAAMIQTPVIAVTLGAAVTAVFVELLHPRIGLLRRLARSWMLWLGILVIVDFDIVITWFKLAGQTLSGSITGWQMLIRWVGLAVIVIGLLRARSGRSPWAIGAVLVGFTGWSAMTAAMTLAPSPNYFAQTRTIEVFLGYAVDAAPEFLTLLSAWRIDLLMTTIAAVAMIAYGVGRQTIRRRGETWPLLHTVSWMAGWVTAIAVTSSGVGKYSTADFGLHMVVHMVLNMIVPILLVLGGPLSLLQQATAGSGRVALQIHARIEALIMWRWTKFLLHPLLVFVVYVSSLYILYLTPVFGSLVQYHFGHQLMNVSVLIIGCAFFSLVVGIDRLPAELPQLGRLGFLLAAMPFHAFFGIVLTTAQIPVAQNFYRSIDLDWLDISGAQAVAGVAVWAGGQLPLLAAVIILAVRWTRQDGRADSRADDVRRLHGERDAYGDALARLARRGAGAPTGRRGSASDATASQQAGALQDHDAL